MSLQFTLNHAAPASAAVDCIIVGAFSDKSLSPAAQALDAASGGRIAALVERGDVGGKTGNTTVLHDLAGVAAPRVLVVGLGDAAKFGVPQYIKAVGDAARALRSGITRSALFTLSELEVKGRDAAWNIRQAVIAANHASYRYTATLGKKKPDAPGLETLAISGSDETALAQGQAIAAGVEYARELGNLPPNLCTPAYLAESSARFAAEHEGAQAEILDEQQMEALGMGSLLAVARGSANRPKLVVLKWNNGGDAKPYVLVGKGITFDTGGVNLKTQGGIEEMKYDMCGGANVIGTFVAAVKARLPLNLVVVVPAVENAIDGNAYRPSDVITSMSGKTIEVGNTDAEGRLILCDALAYASEMQPDAIIDFATLTGAARIALGPDLPALFANDDTLARQWLDAGEQTRDPVWRMPLWRPYQRYLNSGIADMANAGSRMAGSVTAALYLERFVDEGRTWAHLDVYAWNDSDRPGRPAGGEALALRSAWAMLKARYG